MAVKKTAEWISSEDLARVAAMILAERGPLLQADLRRAIREAGWQFTDSRLPVALQTYGGAYNLERDGTRPVSWRVRTPEPKGYGPDKPNGRPGRVTIPDGPEAIEFQLLPAVGPGECRRPIPGQLDASIRETDGGGLPIGAPHPARPAGLAGVLANAHQLARDLGIPIGFPHPAAVDRAESTVDVSPIAGASFKGPHGLGSWNVIHPAPDRDLLIIYPPQGEPIKLAVGTAVALADALRVVTAQATVRLRESQSAD